MNYLSILLGGAITFLGLTILGFNHVESNCVSTENANENWGTQSSFVNHTVKDLSDENRATMADLDFFIYAHYPAFGMTNAFGNYGRSITENNLHSAETLEDLFDDYPASWIDKYESVWIKAISSDKTISLMSKDNKFSIDQKNLFNKTVIGTFYDIAINFERKDPLTKKVLYERINIGLTVVPEKEAHYPLGKEQLITYFKENIDVNQNEVDVDKLQSIVVKFLINQDGKAIDLNQTGSTGNADLDQQVLRLILDMPKWNPAEDANGHAVNQAFELVFGRPGC